ncbi:hypothetical protein LCM20_14715 [Halobacillus litoralis]|uniref:hypothetical protein n=1 Tax=Halobacillus litoralis TaxID=45668 RepID=UPI001CD44AC5|nr:hypothetical protein [Halobacillus litoralis]MCA0971856.1 hypothetical protein [Halobacillus litoralis]
MGGDRWVVFEEDYLRVNYLTVDIDILAKTLGRTRNSVILKANRMGLTKTKIWSEEDFEKLVHFIDCGMSIEEIENAFENKFTKQQIISKAHSNSLTFKAWSKKEDDILISEYPYSSMSDLKQKLPKRSELAIKSRANKLQLKKQLSWTTEQEEEFSFLYIKNGIKGVLSKFPHMKKGTIVSKAQRLGLSSPRNWSTEELTIILESDNKKTINELLQLLPNRTKNSIFLKANELEVSVRKSTHLLTYELEQKFILDYPEHTMDEMLGLYPNLNEQQILRLGKEHDCEPLKKERAIEAKCVVCQNTLPTTNEFFKLGKSIRTCRSCMSIKEQTRTYKERFGIILGLGGVDSIDIIQWYEYLFTTPNGKNLGRLPLKLCTEENFKKIWRYAITKKLKYSTRSELLCLSQQELLEIRVPSKNKEGRYYKVIEILNMAFPELQIQPWELTHKESNYFDNKGKVYDALDWLVSKYNFTIEDILKNKLNRTLVQEESLHTLTVDYQYLSDLINEQSSRLTEIYNFTDILIWYISEKYGLTKSYSDFKQKPKKYMNIKDNANYELRKFVDSLFEQGILKKRSFKKDLRSIFNPTVLSELGQYQLITAVSYHYNTVVFYEWLNELFPDWNLTPKDFKQIISFDGFKLDSQLEADFYSFAKQTLNLDINIIGRNNQQYKFENTKDDENYIPDFYVEGIFEHSDKSLLIELFGMYKPLQDIRNSQVLRDYHHKTSRKNKFFHSLSEFEYIGVFPQDLENNYEGFKNKLNNLEADNHSVS